MFSTAAGTRRWIDARVKNGELRKNMPAGRGRCARPAELVKKVFLTSSQTRPTSLGSRLKRLRLAAAHSLTLARLRAEKYFLRRTRRRRKWLKLYLRLRAQTLRDFFDRRKATGAAGGFNFILRLWPFRTDPSKPCRSSWNTPRPDASGRWGDSGRIPESHRSDRRHSRYPPTRP